LAQQLGVVWVGVDVGKQAHHVAAVDAEGGLVWSTRVVNDQAAIEKVIARAGRTAGEVRWAVDMTSAAAALLLALLVAGGNQVVYVPGTTVNRMAGAFAGEGKTDAKDARVIAETARLRRDLTVWTAPHELVAELALLVSHRAALLSDWVRGINRLRELLTAVFPALERAFDYSLRGPLILVAGYQTPQALRDAGPQALADYLRREGAWAKTTPALVETALAAAAAQTIRLPGESTTATLVARLARRLLALHQEIKDADKLLKARFRTHPQAEIMESLPGMGPILGAEFLVCTGGDLAAFEHSGRLAAYAGLAPVPRDSGRRTGNLRRPKRYHRTLRRVFYMAALSSLRVNGPSKTFYDRKRTERMGHTKALIALARRLLDVLWALLRDNRPFNPAIPAKTT
jgi:transposase